VKENVTDNEMKVGIKLIRFTYAFMYKFNEIRIRNRDVYKYIDEKKSRTSTVEDKRREREREREREERERFKYALLLIVYTIDVYKYIGFIYIFRYALVYCINDSMEFNVNAQWARDKREMYGKVWRISFVGYRRRQKKENKVRSEILIYSRGMRLGRILKLPQ